MSAGLVIVAVLALAQGVLGVLRALQWIQVGKDLGHRGVLLLPIIGHLAFVLAAMAAIIAALYGLFAWGVLARRSWAWPLGLAVVLVNLALAALPLLAGEETGRTLLGAIVPLVLAVYMLAPVGRRALGGGRA